MRHPIRHIFWSGILLSVLAACGESRERIPADAPGYVKGKAVHPTIKIGKPYRVMGQKYYPEYRPDYDETGIASWYGPNFHGKMTANGETFNQWAMTAAHTTLPMPSMVRVTDLETDRSIVVRINDRGPFADDRIIDLSRGAAEALGTRARGLAKVRVQYLKPETEAYIAKLQLEKPEEWKAIDLAQAKQREQPDKADQADEKEATNALAETPSDAAVALVRKDAAKQLPAIAHAAKPQADALDVPSDFAYQHPERNIETTISERGLQMEEIGYAEDAFSVLDDARASSPLNADNIDRQAHALAEPTVPPMPLAASQELYVRAATFADRHNAVDLAKKLRYIAPTQVRPLDRRGERFWRVTVGPALNRGVAEAIRSKLADHDIVDAMIVRLDEQ